MNEFYTGRFLIRNPRMGECTLTIFLDGRQEKETHRFEGDTALVIEQLKVHEVFRERAVAYFENSIGQNGLLRRVRDNLRVVAEKSGAVIRRVTLSGRRDVVCVEYQMPEISTQSKKKPAVRERCGPVEELADHFERLGSRRGTPRRSGEAAACRPRIEQRRTWQAV